MRGNFFRFAALVACVIESYRGTMGFAGEIIDLAFSGYVDTPILAINVGDTVRWTDTGSSAGTVESYGGDWKSPLLQQGQSFSHTFTQPGFVAYKTPAPGIVLVGNENPTNSIVHLNFPLDGQYFLATPFGIPLLATLSERVTKVEFFAGTNLVGISTNGPFRVVWTNAMSYSGPVSLTAVAFDLQGNRHSSVTKSVTVGQNFRLFWPRRLPHGEMLLFYSAPVLDRGYLLSTDRVPTQTHNYLTAVQSYGIFVDESATNGVSRFYVGATGELPPK